MRGKTILAVMMAASLGAAVTACNSSSENAVPISAASETVETTGTEAVETAEAGKVTVSEDIDPEIYRMTGGTWFYSGIEDEKSIDMDGLKGFTAYTADVIPEYEGYLKYLGENEEGYAEFDVLDMSGRQFMKLTFMSEGQFYVDDDEEQYYVKWDY